MRKHARTETAKLKQRIQALVRAIVIKRDGGCLLRGYLFPCHTTLQANHLVSRGKNVGYADTRLIVCLCLSHHKGYHSQQETAYKKEIRALIGPERCAMWDRAEADQKHHNMTAWDWGKEAIALEYQLAQML